jgi:hypothetical protein
MTLSTVITHAEKGGMHAQRDLGLGDLKYSPDGRLVPAAFGQQASLCVWGVA